MTVVRFSEVWRHNELKSLKKKSQLFLPTFNLLETHWVRGTLVRIYWFYNGVFGERFFLDREVSRVSPLCLRGEYNLTLLDGTLEIREPKVFPNFSNIFRLVDVYGRSWNIDSSIYSAWMQVNTMIIWIDVNIYQY